MTSTRMLELGTWILLWAGLALPQAIAASPSPDINVLVREIAEQMRSDPDLHGAWLEAELDKEGRPGVPPGRFTFRRVLDVGRAETQKAKLSRLIQTWVPGGNYAIDAAADRQYPFSELMEKLDRSMSVHPGLAGGRVNDGYYEPSIGDPERLNLVLVGRALSEDMVEKIERLASTIMQSDTRWVRRQELPRTGQPEPTTAGIPLEINPTTAKLEVIAPSEAQGHLSFTQGMQRFWQGDYTGAAAAFREAVLEAPRRTKYYYWQSLAEMASGQSDLAYQRIYNLIRLSHLVPYSDTHREIMRSIERVQGSLRAELRELEYRAVAEAGRMNCAPLSLPK